MTARRLLRRIVRRATKPVQLWINRYQVEASEREVERLRMLRADAAQREQREHRNQVRLEMRRNQIERGYA